MEYSHRNLINIIWPAGVFAPPCPCPPVQVIRPGPPGLIM